MEPVFAYLAGLLTLINPCVLPVLPIVLASALQDDRRGPAYLALGMSVSFVAFGVGVAVFGRALGITEDGLVRTGALAMMGFGLVQLSPGLSRRFATATAGLSGRADAGIAGLDQRRAGGQVLGGALLGMVWVPCVGPTLGGAIALASAGQSIGWAALTMTGFALGISTVILALGYGTAAGIRARRDWMRALSGRARPLMGLIFILTGLALWFHWFRAAEIWLLDTLPYWLQDLSVRF